MPTILSQTKQFLHRFLPDDAYDRLILQKDILRSELGRRRRVRVERLHRGKSHTVIVFLIVETQTWNSIKTVYEACRDDPAVTPYLVVVDTHEGEETYRDCLRFMREIDSNAIDSRQGDSLFDIRTLDPEFVFYQSPYNSMFPAAYSMPRVASYAKIGYIPYGFGPKHLFIEYDRPLVEEAWVIFADSDHTKCYLENLNHPIPPRRDIRIFSVGHPRFDLMEPCHAHYGPKKVFGWTPRWSTNSIEKDGTNFFNYKDQLVDYFQKRPELELIIRPHPLMFRNFVKKGVMTQDEVDRFKAQIARTPNISLDPEPDYRVLFRKADAMIMDWSSLDFEYMMTGKPIIYCGDPHGFSDSIRELMLLSYQADCWEKLQEKLVLLIGGQDPLLEQRLDVIRKIRKPSDHTIGETIVGLCKKI